MTARELLAAATPRPWRWMDANETTEWALPSQLIRYRLLDSPGRIVLNHAQTWQVRDAEADLIVGAVNEYEALLDIVDALDAPAVTAALHRAAADATLDPEAFDRDFATLSAVFNARTRLDAVRSVA